MKYYALRSILNLIKCSHASESQSPLLFPVLNASLREGRGNLESRIEKQMRLNSHVTGLKPLTEILEIKFNVRASKILDVQIFVVSNLSRINQYGTDQPPKNVNNTHLSLRAGKFNMG